MDATREELLRRAKELRLPARHHIDGKGRGTRRSSVRAGPGRRRRYSRDRRGDPRLRRRPLAAAGARRARARPAAPGRPAGGAPRRPGAHRQPGDGQADPGTRTGSSCVPRSPPSAGTGSWPTSSPTTGPSAQPPPDITLPQAQPSSPPRSAGEWEIEARRSGGWGRWLRHPIALSASCLQGAIRYALPLPRQSDVLAHPKPESSALSLLVRDRQAEPQQFRQTAWTKPTVMLTSRPCCCS